MIVNSLFKKKSVQDSIFFKQFSHTLVAIWCYPCTLILPIVVFEYILNFLITYWTPWQKYQKLLNEQYNIYSLISCLLQFTEISPLYVIEFEVLVLVQLVENRSMGPQLIWSNVKICVKVMFE